MQDYQGIVVEVELVYWDEATKNSFSSKARKNEKQNKTENIILVQSTLQSTCLLYNYSAQVFLFEDCVCKGFASASIIMSAYGHILK